MPQAGGPTGTRLLLRRLRDVMAGGGKAQQRLDKIVTIVAADMVAEVCSAYVMRPGEVLELFATKGLRPEAVHKTRLRVGEGIVGDVAAHARPLALAEAQSHPNFAYRPETGEEIYHSMMGVPILRGGRVLGVLAVQNRTPRHYHEEEVETLETVATVLAELVASGELVAREELEPTEGIAVLPVRLEGVVLNGGLAMGQAVLHETRIMLKQMVAEDPRRELERLREAVATMQSALDDMLASSDLADGGEHRDILETYRMFAEDRGWLGRIAEIINSGLTAEAAVQKVKDDMRARLDQVVDPYLRERVLDLEDLGNRLIKHLMGDTAVAATEPLPDDVILVARDMGPAELLDYDRKRLRGLVLEEGSATSHVAIVARAIDIPVVGRVNGLFRRVEPKDALIIDGDNGTIFVRPGEDIRQHFLEGMRARSQRKAMFAATRELPAVTRDGVAISLNINAGLLIDVPHLHDSGADGIGLYRTEIPFMVRSEFPDVAAQVDIYRKILDLAGAKPVVFRTLDVGGDKVLPYWRGEDEENPAMGWRAIRIGLDRPIMLRQQLRALIRAAADRPLHVMFPMISDVAEFVAARRVLELELKRLRAAGKPAPSDVKVGAMFEVPALAWQLEELLSRVDFLSVGSNDLRQFLFASDRGSPRIADRYDTLSPAMLGILGQLARACAAAGKPLSLCGEMAGQPVDAMALIGLGFRTLSMAPPAVGAVKTMIRSLDVARLQTYLTGIRGTAAGSLRGRLRAFARDHNVAL
ncbi:MAG TPA: phosphoenolpyruvate--protein phosphotransferase [Candidatus Acidoferrum sp.]|nr:phosphoenolpyruvate--protein phosphotransferase [Candidatus Acidoferrum sp.]